MERDDILREMKYLQVNISNLGPAGLSHFDRMDGQVGSQTRDLLKLKIYFRLLLEGGLNGNDREDLRVSPLRLDGQVLLKNTKR